MEHPGPTAQVQEDAGQVVCEVVGSDTEIAKPVQHDGRRVAKAIVKRRELSPVRSAKDLAEIVAEAAPSGFRRDRINPATKVFQAIRIAVNEELEGLGDFVREAVSLLASSGRIAVIAYHSLEDRIVKTAFRDLEKGCVCPPRLPICGCGRQASVRLPERNAMRPAMDEVLSNPSSRSARLRYAEKI